MKNILQSKPFRLFLVCSFLQLVCMESLFARGKQSVVNNIRHERTENTIVISYDIADDLPSEYQVNVVMLRKSDEKFRYIPENIHGDMGRNVPAGMNHRIEWNTNKEFPDGLAYNDYYFSVQAVNEEVSSTSTWIWVGAAIVVAGVVYFLVNKEKEELPNEFPQPPGRP